MADTEEAKEEAKEVDSVVEVEMAAATAEEEAKGADSAAATAEDLAAEDSAVAATADSAEDSAEADSAVHIKLLLWYLSTIIIDDFNSNEKKPDVVDYISAV